MLRVIIFLLAAVFTTAEGTRGPLTRLAVLHRHGARLPAVVLKGEMNWDFADLTDPGKDMLMSLANSLRQRYSSFLPTSYDPLTMYSRATNYDRTRQSATILINTLFPGPTDLPPVFYLSNDEEFALRFKIPATALKRSDGDVSLNKKVTELILAKYGNETVMRVGATLGQTALCASSPTLCFLLAHEYAMSNYANGEKMDPLWAELENFDEWMAYFYHHTEAYPGDPEYMKQIGGTGYRVMHEILTVPAGRILTHLSGHDNSIIGAYTALGQLDYGLENSTRNIPNFAETLLFESYDDDTVSVWWGYPNQTFGSDSAYQWWPLPIACTSALGVTTRTQSTCSTADWARYLDTFQAPTAADGICYADPADLTATGCYSVNVAPSKRCLAYRKRCPALACPAGYFINVAHGYTCYQPPPATPTESGGEPMSTGIACVITACAIIAVASIMFAIMWYHKQQREEQMPDQEEGLREIGREMIESGDA